MHERNNLNNVTRSCLIASIQSMLRIVSSREDSLCDTTHNNQMRTQTIALIQTMPHTSTLIIEQPSLNPLEANHLRAQVKGHFSLRLIELSLSILFLSFFAFISISSLQSSFSYLDHIWLESLNLIYVFVCGIAPLFAISLAARSLSRCLQIDPLREHVT